MRSVVIAMGLAVMIVVAGCAGARQLRLIGSPDVPAAQGTVKLSTTDNGNTKMDVVVEHLAPPERVTPEGTVYVVWVRGAETGAQAQSLGALRVDDKLKGSITAVTPLRAFDLFITVESAQTVAAPTGKTLLSATVAMK